MTKIGVIGVDSACYDLAHHFLVQEVVAKPLSDEAIKRNLTSLSEAIQNAVDDWFAAQNWELIGADAGSTVDEGCETQHHPGAAGSEHQKGERT